MIIEKRNRLVRVIDVTSDSSKLSLSVRLGSGERLTIVGSRLDSESIGLFLPDEAFTGFDDELEITVAYEGGSSSAVFAIGPDIVEGRVERVGNGCLHGWAARQVLDTPLSANEFELRIDGLSVSSAGVRIGHRPDLMSNSLCGGFDGFTVALPESVFDGASHTLTLCVSGRALASDVAEYRFVVRGMLDIVEAGRLSGWCFEAAVPANEPLALRIETETSSVHTVLANQPVVATETERACGFSVALDPQERAARISPAFAPGIDLFPRSALVPMVDQVEAITRLAATVRLGSRPVPDDVAWWQTVGFEAILGAVRAGAFHPPARTAERIPPLRRGVIDPRRVGGVSVVMPVYADFEVTRRCLEALASSNLPQEARVIIIDDASPDPDLSNFVAALCQRHSYRYIRQAENRGFIATVNHGFDLAEADDVVLLNADTLVPPNWLQRLVDLAALYPEAASLTPMSNNATLLSYPCPTGGNAAPSLEETIALDALFEANNAACVVDLPTGHGFCLYLRRSALDEVGAFDPSLGRGYAEENDWCMRASARGYRHLAACNVFVAHEGARSFGSEKWVWHDRNLARLRERYPEYDARIQRFLAVDPLANPRNAVGFAQLAQQQSPLALHLVNNLGGGVQRFVLETSVGQYDGGLLPLFLMRRGKGSARDPDYQIRCFSPDIRLHVRASQLADALARLEANGLVTIHLHTLAGVDFSVLPTLFAGRARIVTTLHDYSWTCPRIFLLQDRDRFCEQPASPTCQTCIAQYGTHPALIEYAQNFESVAQYRAFASSILEKSDAVDAVSHDVAERIARIHPYANVTVQPPPPSLRPSTLTWPVPRAGLRRVAVPGSLETHKGYTLVLATARAALARASLVQFIIIGSVADHAELERLPNVAITGRYSPGQGVRLIRESRAECGLLLSPWPETYSYTLSECWEAGLPVLALDLGAPADRIRSEDGGWLIPAGTDGEGVVDALEEILWADMAHQSQLIN